MLNQKKYKILKDLMMHIKNKGFTLVEIMIVVLIVALLATLAIPNALRTRINANDATAQVALKAISTALENYTSRNDEYPLNSAILNAATPPYLNVDYFTGTHNGFTFVGTFSSDAYSITATPAGSNLGSRSFTISTGGVLAAN